MPDFGGVLNKAKELASEHPDQVTREIEKLEDLVDKQAGGQFGGQIETAGHFAANYLGAEDRTSC